MRRLVLIAVLWLSIPAMPIRADADPVVRASALTDELKTIVGVRKVGVAILPINDAAQVMSEVGVNIDDQYSVASAFKGPVAIYFFENTPREIWSDLPLDYWNIDKDDQIPDEFQSTWENYHVILKAVYQMAIYSENDSTGNVLKYVYEERGKPAANAIIAFNDWSHTVAGTSDQSGMEAWFAGGSSCASGCVDTRYGQEVITYRHKIVWLGNSYSPRDLATFYIHLATKGRDLGYYDTAMELLSYRKQYPSLTKQYGAEQGLQVASKDGFVGPYSAGSNGFYVSTDAGIFTLPDGQQYAVAFMALDAGDVLHDVISASSVELAKNSKPQ